MPLKIIDAPNEEDFINVNQAIIKNSLIITKSDKKLLMNKNLTNKNLLIFNDLPLPINKLIELINIQLIKLRFNYQSKINIKNYEMDLNIKFLSKEKTNLKLTEKEIEIILYLNADHTKHNVLDLQKNIWEYSPDMETHTVETHIYRLRKKISDKFNDENFILSRQNAYFIH